MRPTEKRGEPVESLDRDMTTTESTTHRRKREAILGRDGIDGGVNPDNVQETGDPGEALRTSYQRKTELGLTRLLLDHD
jgi:hypothetical protein